MLLVSAAFLAAGCGGGGGDRGITPPDTTTPVPDFTATAVGGAHSCGIAGTGYAFCWGRNASGELGTSAHVAVCEGASYSCSAVPLRVALAPRVASIAAGDSYSCAIAVGGQAYCWGADGFGQLGDGASTGAGPNEVAAGAVRFRSIVASVSHSCAIATSGSAYCWGLDDRGQLGGGVESSGICGSARCSHVPVEVVGGHLFKSLALRDGATCGLTTSGAEFCWGKGVGGADGLSCQQGSATDCTHTPIAVDAGDSLTAIGMSDDLDCGLTGAGVIRCWGGTDYSGMLGNGTTGTVVTAPADVAGGASWSSFVEGSHSICALDAAGTAKCWGSNSNGQLGTGAASPQELQPTAVAGDHQFTALFASNRALFTCGITKTAQTMCWGLGGDGQLGSGEMVSSASPVEVQSP